MSQPTSKTKTTRKTKTSAELLQELQEIRNKLPEGQNRIDNMRNELTERTVQLRELNQRYAEVRVVMNILRSIRAITRSPNVPDLKPMERLSDLRQDLANELKKINMTQEDVISRNADISGQIETLTKEYNDRAEILNLYIDDYKKGVKKEKDLTRRYENALREEYKQKKVTEIENKIKKKSSEITRKIETDRQPIPLSVLSMDERDGLRTEISKIISQYRSIQDENSYTIEFHDSIYQKIVILADRIKKLTTTKPNFTRNLIVEELDLIAQGIVNGYLHYENINFVLQELEKLYHDISLVPEQESSNINLTATDLFSVNRSTDSSGSGSQPFLGGKDTPSIQTGITLQTTPTIQTGGGSGMSSVPPSNQVDNGLRIRFYINGIDAKDGIGEIILVP